MKLLTDLKAYSKGSFKAQGLLNILFYINFLYRLSHFFYKMKLFPIAKLIWILNRLIFNVDIDPRANIDGGFVIKHGLGIVIGAYANIGKNFTIYQGVTIGGNSGKTRQFEGIELKQPLIFENVTIGPNSIVIGPIVLHERCQIGAGSIITKDVLKRNITIGNNKVIRSN
nr:DapH/DapD/GlmU-related protein [uncultured Draconibacterium sp.]